MLALQGIIYSLTFSSLDPLGVSKKTPAHSRLSVYMEGFPDDQRWQDGGIYPSYAPQHFQSETPLMYSQIDRWKNLTWSPVCI